MGWSSVQKRDSNAIERALGDQVWGRRVALLPERGILLVATDLHGNRRDYERIKAIYAKEKRAGNEPILAFCGDLVHGPSPELNEPGRWPDYLGTEYRDGSAALILDFERLTRTEQIFSLLGNHDHAHIGGPIVPKFYPDEAAVLDAALGPARFGIHDMIRRFPMLAIGPCGVVLTHAAPSATERNLAAFERLRYSGYERVAPSQMPAYDTLGALLWSRMASRGQARRFLQATAPDGAPNAFVVFGHEVISTGWERVSDELLCVSTSFGLYDWNKVYLRLDLSQRYRSASDLRIEREIRALYP